MAREMGVNPNTMARAYRELEREGFVTTHRGEGSFIAADPRRVDQERNRLAASARDRFVEEVRELALVPAQIHELLRDLVNGAEDG
jgi:GntR family transcriptional regulator